MNRETSEHNCKWYVIRTRSLAEKKVNDRLIALNFSTFLPLQTTWKQWSDRKKKITSPLISSTVFVRCNATQLKNVYSVQGVIGVLNYLGMPAIVRDHEIENLRILTMELAGEGIEMNNEKFHFGDSVKVTRGPFKGLYGTSVEVEGRHRLLITIDAVGAAFTVNVPKSFVKKVNDQLVA